MKKAKKRKYIFIGTITIVLGILSFIVYQSYAYFKVNYTGNIINTIVGAFGSYEYAYTGSVQEFVVPKAGYYELELWGGGLGAYTKGIIYLNKDENLYIYVGQASFAYTNYGAWNGGGVGGTSTITGSVYNEYNGSAATDVRLIKASSTDNTIWNESISLRSRIMVAAGSGGETPGTRTIASGGTLIGNNGTRWGSGAVVSGYGATQTSSQTIGGGFGYGGNGSNNSVGGAGGGGGYYGGGGGYGFAGNSAYGGGSGSSYISGYSGVNSVEESGGTVAQPLHTNNTIHYSGKYFIKGSMQAGINTGNGKAKITYIGTEIPERTNTKLDNVRYIKSCINGSTAHSRSHWVELQAIKEGINVAKGKAVTGTISAMVPQSYSRVTDGDITAANYVEPDAQSGNVCITVDLGMEYDIDEITLWLYWSGGRVYYDNVLSVGPTNTSGTPSLSTVLHNYPGTTGYVETSQGKRYTAWD